MNTNRRELVVYILLVVLVAAAGVGYVVAFMGPLK